MHVSCVGRGRMRMHSQGSAACRLHMTWPSGLGRTLGRCALPRILCGCILCSCSGVSEEPHRRRHRCDGSSPGVAAAEQVRGVARGGLVKALLRSHQRGDNSGFQRAAEDLIEWSSGGPCRGVPAVRFPCGRRTHGQQVSECPCKGWEGSEECASTTACGQPVAEASKEALAKAGNLRCRRFTGLRSPQSHCASAHHHVRSIAWSRSKLAPVPSRTSRSAGGRPGTLPRRRLPWTLCRSRRAEAEISRPSGSS